MNNVPDWSATTSPGHLRTFLREHFQLGQRFPGARLASSGGCPVFSDPTWWVTSAGVPLCTGEQANAWCSQKDFDADLHFGKIVSRTQGRSGTTLS